MIRYTAQGTRYSRYPEARYSDTILEDSRGDNMSKDQNSVADITLGVLAGGAGRRLGHQDKGLVELAGRPLVSWVRHRLAPSASTCLISANRNAGRYTDLGAAVYPDEIGDEAWPGPLAGVITLLRHCPTPWLQLAPCDAPLLPPDLPQRLRAAALEREACAVVPYADGRAQWACALIARQQRPALEAAFCEGTRSLAAALDALAPAYLDSEAQASAFANINTPEDLDAVAAQLPRPR